MFRYLVIFLMLSAPVRACDLALLLAVDVSGSVDPQEYRVQMDGLALALRDGTVADALVEQQAYVSLAQWTGASRQRQTVPWTAIRSYQDVLSLADTIENDPRVWCNYSTAIGEALFVSAEVLASVGLLHT